jgi:hypothetical protein
VFSGDLERDKTGMSEVADTVLSTTHQNQISCIQIKKGTKDKADLITTSAGDGKVVTWDLRSFESQMQDLTF